MGSNFFPQFQTSDYQRYEDEDDVYDTYNESLLRNDLSSTQIGYTNSHNHQNDSILSCIEAAQGLPDHIGHLTENVTSTTILNRSNTQGDDSQLKSETTPSLHSNPMLGAHISTFNFNEQDNTDRRVSVAMENILHVNDTITDESSETQTDHKAYIPTKLQWYTGDLIILDTRRIPSEMQCLQMETKKETKHTTTLLRYTETFRKVILFISTIFIVFVGYFIIFAPRVIAYNAATPQL